MRVLHLEDNDGDGELVALILEKAALAPEITRVASRKGFESALTSGRFDLILSDFSLPDFDGLSALTAVRAGDFETPFIFVSGTIGEERAVHALRLGATDYILKDRLSRLPSAIVRALEERRERDARKAAEEQNREQAALLNNAREAIVVADLSRKITYWNKGAERLYGWSAEEAKAGMADERFPAQSRAEIEIAWQTVLRDGAWSGSVRQATRDGREIVVELHCSCLGFEEGAPRAVMSIGVDVSQAHMLEEQLMRAQRLETVGLIAGGVAHDLNNVLAPILIGISSLKRKVADESGQRLLGTMELGVERGADIVRQVLTFARGHETGKSFETRDMIRGIERLLAASLSREVELTMEIADTLPPLTGDATQLQQVLLNLCVNARDAMPDGGTLIVRADCETLGGERAGDYVCIRVKDTGEGMPAEVRAKIFEPFFTTKAKGTGIGLSTVASIVKRHGGFIEVESESGQGTEFRVFLPVAPPPSVSSAPERGVHGNGELLLVIDEGSVRHIIKGTLEAYGYQVVDAETIEAAVAAYGQHRAEVAAVLANLGIPELDGVALIRGLSQHNPRVKVINTSGLTDILHVEGVESLVRATLPRPYSAEKLVDVVAQVLEMA